MNKLNKVQTHVIKVVTLGGVLEWFDIYSFIYLAPTIGRIFFDFHSSLSNLLGALLLFGTGFISRPFGAILFGRIGDLIGRKTAFMFSIIVMTVPTFLMGCLPTYSSIGIFAPILFYLLRLIQSIPASGEIPGTICLLYENADKNNSKYMTSWTYVGNQIGAILGIFVTVLTDNILSESSMLQWGWRVSFWAGGLLGLLGIYMRHTLTETPTFKRLVSHHSVDKETVGEVITNHKTPILLGVGFGAINAVTFYLFATYVPDIIGNFFQANSTMLSCSMIALLAFMTMLIPFFGKLAESYCSQKIFIYSSVFVIMLLFPLFIAVNSSNLHLLIVIGILFSFPIASISAVYPYWIARIFHSKIRYTAIGLSFNFADGIIGGLSPAIALAMIEYTNNKGSFCFYVLLCSIISIISFRKIKKTTSA